ncbi:uncharacterized protein BO96DRAFT_111193 [Aspergillus niger CBS 101883]|uniref:uncharacterized protein n=1 Tax=Aspergillus lacticoffeatus (strain CBS 101883) TaxID=1450533 RepID=UPI000D80444A|nr:uncharacterized protein BO96DRAFT_111193 [Aspergillus niger CBS 101883]PYH54195.1 hypothetical protein BO96DRAFT_111193 [Aspergillus niger CBS 101883]
MEGRLYRFYLSWRSGTVPLSPSILPCLFFARQLHSAGRVGARSSRLVYMWVCFLFNHRNGILVIYILLMGYWVDCPEGTVGERRERKRETASCLDLTVQNRRQQERAHTAGNHSTVDAGGAGWISFSSFLAFDTVFVWFPHLRVPFSLSCHVCSVISLVDFHTHSANCTIYYPHSKQKIE